MAQEIKSSVCHCVNLRRASRALTKYYNRALEKSDLTVSQYSIMKGLKKIQPCGTAELSKAMRLDRTTLVRDIRVLEQKGFVEDDTPEDRTRSFRCSGKGERVLSEAEPLWARAQKNLEDYIGRDEVEKIMEAMLKIEMLSEEESYGFD